MEITFGELRKHKHNTVIVGVLDNCQLSDIAKELDAKTGGMLLKACNLKKFKGKKGQFVSLLLPHGLEIEHLVLAGLGAAKDITAYQAQCIGGAALAYANGQKAENVAFLVDGQWEGCALNGTDVAANIAYGARLRDYRFDKYRTKEKEEDKPTVKTFAVHLDEPAKAKTQFGTFEKVADAVFTVRNLVSEPANIIFPESLANHCKTLASLGIDVQVLGEAQMKELGMHSLLGVGQGSVNESKLVVMRWDGAPSAKEKPIAFVGKGVTFDTGGISIKPAGGMEEMKWDMGGAAVVIGVMKALAARKAKVNAVGVVGLVENMPSGNAQRPGDVVKSMSGQTIEVINTDAEGRLVLADALWYTQEKYKPGVMVNLATLTGAIIVAIGSHQAGLFSNDDDLADKLAKAGKEVGEELWRMPLSDVYDKQINSDIADMRNVGEGREAGSSAAAQFLQRFVQDGVKWAHLDIAGVAWSKKDADITPKGATAFGVRLLERLVDTHYEG